jgi:hypothetical protein
MRHQLFNTGSIQRTRWLRPTVAGFYSHSTFYADCDHSTDRNCVCNNPSFQAAAGSCILAHCDLATALALQQQECGGTSNLHKVLKGHDSRLLTSVIFSRAMIWQWTQYQ